MRPTLLIGAGLAGLTTLVHVFAGGPEINAVVQASALDDPVRAVLAVLWHGTTALLAVSAAGLCWAAVHPNRGLEVFISVIMLLWAALFVYFGIVMLGNLTVMPQWSVFLLIPAMVGLGWRRGAGA